MSFVIAATEQVQGATRDLATIGASLVDAAATVSGPTTGIAAGAQDEVSVAIASLFGKFGQEFQALSVQAQAFHTQFVNLLNASAGAYVSAEVANAQQSLLGGVKPTGAPHAASASIDPLARWSQVFATTTQNAQTVFGASQQGLHTFFGGVSTGLRQLATSPAAFFGNLRNAAQSVFLVGAQPDVALEVVRRTLGGVTSATNPGAIFPDPTVVPIDDVHVQLYRGLAGLGAWVGNDFVGPAGSAT